MVNHMGGLSGGHYTATVLSKKDKSWYEFDDAQVRKAGGQPSANKIYNSSTAYLLVYRGKDKGGRSSRKKIKERLKIKRPEKKKQKAQKSQKSKETTAEDVAGGTEEQEGEVIGPEEQREDEDQREDEEQKEHEGGEHQEDGEQKEDEEHQGNGSGRNSDDEETTQLGRHEEDDGQMRKEREEERLQDGGDEVTENRKPAVTRSDDLPDTETTAL
ncbi:uncharacterized protein AB9X84_015769 isoform 1-T1 [Acanthopagrus schlegelii]